MDGDRVDCGVWGLDGGGWRVEVRVVGGVEVGEGGKLCQFLCDSPKKENKTGVCVWGKEEKKKRKKTDRGGDKVPSS